MKIRLKHLAIFEAIARHGNVSKAANDIALSQSAASMALAELEGHLNAPLFHRHGKRLSLNDYGRWLQPKVHQLLMQVTEIEQSANQDQLKGLLKVGASSTIGNYLVPEHIASFVQTHDAVSIELNVQNTERVINDMINMKIDIGLIEGPCHSQQLVSLPWRTDTLAIFCGAQHPLAKQDNITPEDLLKQQWILREQGSGTREIFSLATQGVLDNLKVKLELGNSEAIKQAVKTGLGLGCLSELAIASEVKHKELKVLSIPFINLERVLYQIKRPDTYSSQLMTHFLESIL